MLSLCTYLAYRYPLEKLTAGIACVSYHQWQCLPALSMSQSSHEAHESFHYFQSLCTHPTTSTYLLVPSTEQSPCFTSQYVLMRCLSYIREWKTKLDVIDAHFHPLAASYYIVHRYVLVMLSLYTRQQDQKSPQDELFRDRRHHLTHTSRHYC